MAVESKNPEEREILHDISNQLVIVQGMSGLVLKAIKRKQVMGDKELDRMEKVLVATRSIAKMIQNRRNYLNSISS